MHPTLVLLTLDASLFMAEELTHYKLIWEENGCLENKLDMS